MDDLIKRQDAIDACFNGKCANIYDCKEAIEKIPSAQKTGHWERIFTCELHTVKCWNVFRCSECGSIKQVDSNDYNWNYCPVCGSRNRGDTDNEI